VTCNVGQLPDEPILQIRRCEPQSTEGGDAIPTSFQGAACPSCRRSFSHKGDLAANRVFADRDAILRMVAQLPRAFLRTGDQKRFLPEALLFGEAVAFGADFVPHLPWEGALHRYVASVLSNVFLLRRNNRYSFTA